MLRIGVIADTHIPISAMHVPKKITDAFRKVDMVAHAGDILELSVLDELKKSCADIKAVWGNMDPYETRKKLPETEIFGFGSHKIGLTHGKGDPAGLIRQLAEKFKDDSVDIIIFGHAHYPVNEEHNGILYFNPGSATDTIYAPYNSYGIIEINDKIEARIVKL